jgi:hypothetical protein
MNRIRIAVVSCVVGLMMSSAASASAVTARIERILIYEGGDLVYVWPVGGIQNLPPCASNGSYYSFSLARPRAKEYLAAMLAAQAQGANVAFYGTGTCTDQSVSETLAYFSIAS